MNKKLFLGMFAAAGMLLATSCQNDELDVVQSGDEAQVTFSLGLEGGIATRAISDGKSADVLMYAVFDEEGNRINTIQKVSKTGVTFPTTENITLAKGQTYKVAFWAQDEDCEAYTVSDDMKVTVNYANDKNKGNNDETRDAFFKTVEFTVTGSTSIDVELKRPFAQINVGVTKADWDAAVASGITVAQSSVVIKNAATELNLLDGTVSGETEVSYELANIPSEPAILQVDADGDGIKDDYNWLSMSYILPSAAPTGYEKAALENVAFVFASNGEPIEFNQGLNNVPVQRNWRTNIVGKILTGDITFNIVIDEEFEDDHNVVLPYATIGDVVYKSFAEAMAAVQDGETIKLVGETTLDGVADGNLFTIEGKSITIDLNGYGFVATVPDVTKNSSIFYVAKNSGLTIVGEGNVKVTTNKAPNVLAAFINNDGGTVNLKGGNWTMTALEYPDALIPTFVDNNSNVNSATLNIYDGTYTFHRNLFRNFANAAGHNNYATVATINIYGGTFNGRESDAGAIWNQKPSATTPNGAGIINVKGGTFNNVNISDDFSGVVYVNNQEELNNALANVNTHTVMLGASEYIIPSSAKGKTLTIKGTGDPKDVKVVVTGTSYENGDYGLDGSTVTFEGITINTNSSTYIGYVRCKGTYKNCVINGTYTLYGDSKFENCTFNVSGDVYNIWTWGAPNATFDGCTFNSDGKAMLLYGTENTKLTIENSVFNDNGGLTDLKAAIEIGNDYDKSYTLVVNNTIVNGYEINDKGINTGTTLWANKDSMGTDKLSVTVDGVENPIYATSQDELENATIDNATIFLAKGEYTIPSSAKGKTLTIKGTGNPEDVKVAVTKVGSGYENVDYGLDGSTVTFEGITITTNSSTYIGYARCNGTYKNCVINGTYTLYGDSKFENCTFNVSGDVYNIWTWGAPNATFDGCTFNSDGKAMLLYGQANTKLTINNCTFNDSGVLDVKKAAIEIGNDYDKSYTLVVNNTKVNGFAINDTGYNTNTTLWANKNEMGKDKLSVTVDGVKVY